MMKKALIDKIINDQQETMYQVYYRVMVHMTSCLRLDLRRKWQKNILKHLKILKMLLI